MSEQPEGPADEADKEEKARRDWHRLFALTWADLLTAEPAKVDWEVDLSRQAQFLDVLIVRTEPGVALEVRLPDGFEELAEHNLITFRSFREAMDGEALDELVGHYVAYRKQASPKRHGRKPSLRDLLPAERFRLFAVSTRYPQGMAEKLTDPVSRGVYRVRSFAKDVTLVVVHELPQRPNNSLMCLFSAAAAQVGYGQQNYGPRSPGTTGLLEQLFGQYLKEADMPLDLKAFTDEGYRMMWQRMTPEERREFLVKASPEERLAGLPPEARLAGLSVEEMLAALSPEAREALRQRLAADAQAPGSSSSN